MDSHHHHDKQPARDTVPRTTLRPPTASSSGSITDRLSAPNPSTQWGSAPTATRTPSWDSTLLDIRDKPLPEPPAQTFMSSTRRKKRPGSLRGRSEGHDGSDASRLNPQSHPHNVNELPRSAPHDQRHFAAARPSSLYDDDDDDLYAPGLPRSPTYPGASRSRGRSPPESNDSALNDEEDMRLFMEATTGLGPIPTFRQNSVIEDTWLQSRPHDPSRPVLSANYAPSPVSAVATGTRYTSTVSPVAETAASYAPYSRAGHASRLTDMSSSALGPFDPSRQVQAPTRQDQSWMAANDSQPDEELPTYASSQAQAQQSQRVEAARRAQELQRRWREGGRKYGPDV